jgi:hypothetical protein
MDLRTVKRNVLEKEEEEYEADQSCREGVPDRKAHIEETREESTDGEG